MPVVLLVSIGLHLLVLALPLTRPGPERHTRDNALTLVSTPPPSAPQESSATDPEPEIPQRPERSETPPPPAPIPPAESDSPRLPENTRQGASPDALRLRRQSMAAARRIANGKNESRNMPEHFGRPPRLPSRPGALDSRLGSVTPRLDRSVRADGRTDTRVVTADGQVTCARRRAARIEEIFNPWMSTAVAMMRHCGRERPDVAAGDDPWQRPFAIDQ
ncbi:MAG: hypothetical protein ACOCSR_04110 [Wenzhouxiangella sp.]